jgi:hypothetical protein
LPLTARLISALRSLAAPDQLAALATIEDLATQIDPEASYPESWLRFRLLPTHVPPGATPDAAPDSPSDTTSDIATGTQLLPDLDALAQSISDAQQRASMSTNTSGHAAPPSISAAALIARWKASPATITRLRSQGLIARRIISPRGRASLAFTLSHVEAFERSHPTLVARPAAYDRLTSAQRDRILKHARRYRALLGLSLNAAAKRIAQRTRRSHEGIRQLLFQHATELGFPDAAPLNARRRRAIDRAHRMGIDIGRLSRLTRRSRSAVRRALAMVEADRLRTLLAPPAHDTPGPLAAPQPPGKPDAKLSTLNEALNAAPARTSLGSSGTADLLELIAAAPHTPPPLAVEERARALAYHRLRTLAREEIEQLNAAHPSAAAIDRITTHLRWAARLKAELIRAQLRVIIETLESRATRPLAHLPAAWLVHALPGVFDAAGRAIDIYEPWRGGRLAGPMTLAIDRHAARYARETPIDTPTERPRAATILMRGTTLPDWTRRVCTWQRWLEPDPRIVTLARQALPTPRDAELIRARFGLDTSAPPATLDELGKCFSIAPTRTHDTLDAAIARALTLARSS